MKLEELLAMDIGVLIDWLINNKDEYILFKKPIKVDNNIEEIEVVGTEILCYDGYDWTVDYVDVEVEYGTPYMANGTEVEYYMELPDMSDCD
jgi:hypothetical protein